MRGPAKAARGPARLARLESRARRVWRGLPGPGLRAAAAVYAGAADGRHLLYELGMLEAREAPLPLVSVGGLTVGGSGKTPVAAAVAGWLLERGRRPAVLMRGYDDELRAHRHLAPGALVLGSRDRWRAAREAARRGADCGVLDDGFAHRALARRFDLVLVDVDALARTNRRRLPAGPFRHPPAFLALADGIVLARRGRTADLARRAADRLARAPWTPPVARCVLRPGRALPANRAAATREPDPAVGFAAIMKPRLFFRQIRHRWPRLVELHSFRDHAVPDRARLEAIVRAAGDRGIVCTLKDAVRLAPRVGEETPVWYVEDILEWEAGGSVIRERVLAALATPASTR